MNNPQIKLVLFALDHVQTVGLSDRADLLEGAAQILKEGELAKACMRAATSIRNCEAHQLRLTQILEEASK